ncbi:MAG: 30S ribosomal protein S13 [Patescibacteria group bacterium]
MVRIVGTEIPDNKKVEYALPYIYGVGISRSRDIAQSAGIDKNKRVKDLTSAELNRLKNEIEGKFSVEGDLRREISGNIKRLKDIKAYRGVRHLRGLPVRGQRTKTNSRTRRGNVRKTMGSGKRKLDKK